MPLRRPGVVPQRRDREQVQPVPERERVLAEVQHEARSEAVPQPVTEPGQLRI
jgi:hypothetical protein